MTVWGRAGERLSESELARRRGARGARRTAAERADSSAREAALRAWRLGQVLPWKITLALDAKGLYGPEVDTACGVEEPTVDQWEAGKRYPTFAHLCALAQLTGMRVDWFTTPEEPPDVHSTSLAFHLPERDVARMSKHVEEFTDAAVEACPGTDDYKATHLF